MIKNEEERLRIGERIATIRKATEWTDANGIRRRGMTQTELAERTGLQRSHIVRLEQGRYGATIDVLAAIAKAMGCRVDFVRGNGEAAAYGEQAKNNNQKKRKTMKKVLSIIFAAMLIGCQGGNGFGQGGENAAQYVKEQVPQQADNIASIETIAEDSLLCDMGFSFAEMQLSKKGLELMQGTIKADEYEALIDSISHAATDITYSWQFSDVVNDSLMKLPQYEFLWRKAYTVRVIMKSGDTREPRVLMDNDGITPRMMEVDMQKAIEDHTRRILEAQETLIANIR